jgi:dephospho-CoA kinase
MIVIGLTGNFGTGKTTVGIMLHDLGAIHFNADEMSRELLNKRTDSYQELIAAFGKGILDNNGEIDRRKLGEVALENSEGSKKINSIMHPRLEKIIIEKLARYRDQNQPSAVIEAALLFSGNLPAFCDYIWVTVAPESVITERLTKNRGYSEQEVSGRLKQQMSQEELRKKANVVIDTNCTLDELKIRVSDAYHRLLIAKNK